MSSNSDLQDNEQIAAIKDTSGGEIKVILELVGVVLQKDRPGRDLVIAVDVSASMGGEKMDRIKTALQFVIRELNLTDRLSVITLSGEGEKLFPLRQINKSSQEEIEDVVNSLVARGGTDIIAGLKMGLKTLNDRKLTNGRVAGLILISDGYNDGTDSSLLPFCDMPVYTFGFGSHVDPTILKAIAYASNGGTYTKVEDLDDLSVAISQPLEKLVTVVVQDVKLTITPLESTCKVALVGSHLPATDDVTGPVILSLGDLYDEQLRKVTLNLFPSPPPLPICPPEDRLPNSFTLTDMHVWLLMCGSCLMAALQWLVALLVRTRKSQEVKRVEEMIQERVPRFANMIENARTTANETMFAIAREMPCQATEEASTSSNSLDLLDTENHPLDSINDELKKVK